MIFDKIRGFLHTMEVNGHQNCLVIKICQNIFVPQE